MAASARTADGPFARVQALVKKIPRGKVATYGQLSQMIGGRLTPVGVGWAIRAAGEDEIPWHRVVNGKGGISTDKFHGGLQRSLLEAEGVKFDRAGLIDLERYAWKPGAVKRMRDVAAARKPKRGVTLRKHVKRRGAEAQRRREEI